MPSDRWRKEEASFWPREAKGGKEREATAREWFRPVYQLVERLLLLLGALAGQMYCSTDRPTVRIGATGVLRSSAAFGAPFAG